MRAKMIIRKHLRLVDGDRMMTHPQFRQKLEAVGFGVFIPIFFVASGIRFDLAALFASPSTILRVLLFLAALLLIRGVPALLYCPLVGSRRSVVAGLLQATSLSFIMAASQIGLELGLITKATGADHRRWIAVGPDLPDYRARDPASP